MLILKAKENMKIVFFTRLFYPHIGGVEKHVLEISKILIKKGHEVFILTEVFSKSYSNTYQSDKVSANKIGEVEGIKVFRINTGKDNWFKKFRVWKELIKHRSLIKEADIVHCHDVFFWFLPFLIIYPFKPVFTTFHGYEGNKIPERNSIAVHRVSEIFSRGNICIGEFFRKWYGTKPTYVSYGAVKIIDVGINKKNIRKKIMYIGRLEEEAGIMQYLKALKLLKDRNYNYTLYVYGDGSQRREAEIFSKKNNLNVVFKGFDSKAESYIQNYNYIFVSRYLGILEALVNKKVIFAVYNNEIKKDYLEMTPFRNFIYICEDYLEIARKVEHLIENKKEEELMIKNGYRWVEKQTWEKLVNLYLKLWNIN